MHSNAARNARDLPAGWKWLPTSRPRDLSAKAYKSLSEPCRKRSLVAYEPKVKCAAVFPTRHFVMAHPEHVALHSLVFVHYDDDGTVSPFFSPPDLSARERLIFAGLYRDIAGLDQR